MDWPRRSKRVLRAAAQASAKGAWDGRRAHHGEDVVPEPLVGLDQGDHDGVARTHEHRHDETNKGVLLLGNQQHEARQKELAGQIGRLPPVPVPFVLPVKEGGGLRQRVRRLGLQRLVACEKKGRVED